MLIAIVTGFFLWQRAQLEDFQSQIERRTSFLNELKAQRQAEVNRLNDSYILNLNQSLTPSVSRGLVGFTVIPRGGGPGDVLSEQPIIPPTNFTRRGGTNLHYGPVQKTTEIDIVNITLIMGAYQTSNVTITITWGNHSPLLILPFQMEGGVYGVFTASLDVMSSPIIVAPGETVALNIASPNKTFLFNSDSFVWLSLKEAPFPPPSKPSFPRDPTEADVSLVLGPPKTAPPTGWTAFTRYLAASYDVVVVPFLCAVPLAILSDYLVKYAKRKSTD